MISKPEAQIFLPVRDYDLAATLESGQVFRWTECGGSWHGVIGTRRVKLTQQNDGILAEMGAPVAGADHNSSQCTVQRGADGAARRAGREECQDPSAGWDWLRHFLQTDVDLGAILRTFPDDGPMNTAVAACRGLRLLRQDPWECLASFILSATKQIVQIRQIVSQLCECFGESLGPIRGAHAPSRVLDRARLFETPGEADPAAHPSEATVMACAFPSAERIAGLTEAQLRGCKMGFRAPHLLDAARHVAEGKLDLESLRALPYAEAQTELMKLRGVGKKIANCVLLFAYGFDSAFPVDVWIERSLRTLYFPRKKVSKKKLLEFAATHFGPHAGYAQQYLFHHARMSARRRLNRGAGGDRKMDR